MSSHREKYRSPLAGLLAIVAATALPDLTDNMEELKYAPCTVGYAATGRQPDETSSPFGVVPPAQGRAAQFEPKSAVEAGLPSNALVTAIPFSVAGTSSVGKV